MSGLLPAAVYGLEVPSGDVMIPAEPDFPASFRITMAAIDPSAEPEYAGTTNGDTPVRATLKLLRLPIDSAGDDDSEDDSEDDIEANDYLDKLLNGEDSEEDNEESSSDDEDKNGGPSDPLRSKKAIRLAAAEKLKQALAEINASSDEDMDVDGTNGNSAKIVKLEKGKAKATGDGEDEDSDEGDLDGVDIEEFVICTLDPTRNYQQPLDITIGENEKVYFKVSGTHSIYLTGNYVIPVDDGHNHRHGVYDDDDEDYDLSPDEDELEDELDEMDELDALDDPRITEVASDEDLEPPKLVKSEQQNKKGKNKRPAAESDEEAAGLDDIMAKSLKPEKPDTNGEAKLSKKQLKKLKNNAGQAVASAVDTKTAKKAEHTSTESPNAKKVQFAKELEQGPSGAATNGTAKATKEKTGEKKDGEKAKATSGIKTVQGVKIDDKKLGSGPAAKTGNRVSMRYIGKLSDGKVFDANKKGAPFSFKLGAGEVIKGWDIGVAGMSAGGERRITIPASLGYGSKGVPGIPPNSQLVFDLKVLEVK